MNIYPATPFGLPDTAPELARRFAMIMAGLAALVARRFLRMPHLSGFTVQFCSYLNRAVRRFYRALTTTAKRRAPLVRADGVKSGRVKSALVRPVSWPSRRGWIVRELGWEAASYLGYLEALLAEVATRAALAAAPGTGRILRPICRMLGVTAAVTPRKIEVPASEQPSAVAIRAPISVGVPNDIVPAPGVIFSGV